MSFIEQNILPKYNSFDKAHNLRHVQRVIKNSLELAAVTGADINMAYAIAAYHDLGMSGPRAIHHITGGKIIAADVRLKKWFTTDQIRIMKEAVEDHRASASRQPRSIYGKIVAEADRDLEPDEVFLRAVEYGLDKYPQKGKEEQWNDFHKHMIEKYSKTGYIKLWIPNSRNAKNLTLIRDIIDDEKKLRLVFDSIYDSVENNK